MGEDYERFWWWVEDFCDLAAAAAWMRVYLTEVRPRFPNATPEGTAKLTDYVMWPGLESKIEDEVGAAYDTYVLHYEEAKRWHLPRPETVMDALRSFYANYFRNYVEYGIKDFDRAARQAGYAPHYIENILSFLRTRGYTPATDKLPMYEAQMRPDYIPCR
jgi:hypothetical protein